MPGRINRLMFRVKTLVYIAGFVVFSLSTFICFAQVIGTSGATYPVVEPDAYEELMEKVKKINWEQIKKRYEQSIKRNLHVDFSVGRATEDRTFTVDLTYTLPYDIVTEDGKVLYPKGFKFNPLDYLEFPYQIVFFNADSKTEIAWLKSQPWFDNPDVFYIVVKGEVLAAEKALNKTVFAATPLVIEKFNISKTPSLLTVQGRQVVIREIGVHGK